MERAKKDMQKYQVENGHYRNIIRHSNSTKRNRVKRRPRMARSIRAIQKKATIDRTRQSTRKQRTRTVVIESSTSVTTAMIIVIPVTKAKAMRFLRLSCNPLCAPQCPPPTVPRTRTRRVAAAVAAVVVVATVHEVVANREPVDTDIDIIINIRINININTSTNINDDGNLNLPKKCPINHYKKKEKKFHHDVKPSSSSSSYSSSSSSKSFGSMSSSTQSRRRHAHGSKDQYRHRKQVSIIQEEHAALHANVSPDTFYHYLPSSGLKSPTQVQSVTKSLHSPTASTAATSSVQIRTRTISTIVSAGVGNVTKIQSFTEKHTTPTRYLEMIEGHTCNTPNDDLHRRKIKSQSNNRNDNNNNNNNNKHLPALSSRTSNKNILSKIKTLPRELPHILRHQTVLL
ncbi:hypothetical protein RFI_30145 [Reticulomyxa filosa]|uniref:Uncharacterized protein n=1 Tax=Reticulomyxa filosa TaxID=46433 RepID=X6LZ89_RETFI|nr:hypothetical protein RFI_30145 [Reticulomyxa filosa]|eukprot:ETO07248.1 hypothetical protein RFI_30145 [Reticulomyxa filosa]